MEVTTPSLDAFQAYARGTDLYRQGLCRCRPFRSFSVPWNSIPVSRWRSSCSATRTEMPENERSAVEYSKRAFALIDRVSERERLAISAVYHMRVSGDADEAAAALQLFVQTFPRASIPRSYRGSFYMSTGQFEKAARDFEEMVRLDPRSWIPHMNLTDGVRAARPVRQGCGRVEGGACARARCAGFHAA